MTSVTIRHIVPTRKANGKHTHTHTHTLLLIMGVLLQLYLKNLVTCGGHCWGNADERNAYHAIRAIQRSCRHVVQYPPQHNTTRTNSNMAASTGNHFLQSLFGGGGGGTTSSSTNNNITDTPKLTQPRRVRLVLQDSDDDGQPVIGIIPATDTTATATTAMIKVRRIDKVQLDGDQIVFYGKSKSSKNQNDSSSTSSAVELLRFSILLSQQQHEPDTYDDYDDDENAIEMTTTTPTNFVWVSADTRNAMVHDWMVFVDWERQRQLKKMKSSANHNSLDDDSDTDADDSNQQQQYHHATNFISRHTQKIQHYAQREMELQRVKRQRESRKAQLLSQTNGGLTYTALAMAKNRESS